jgi:hypothetical protein
MICRRAAGAGIANKLGQQSFQATGITPYLKNGHTLRSAARWQTMPRPTRRRFYDRFRDEFSPVEVERIVI